MTTLNIRQATLKDLDRIVEIEATCFPAAEAAKRASLEERISRYPKGFYVAESEGTIIGFINGACTDGPTIEDKYFETMDNHLDSGKHLMVFGLDVHPDYQHKGYAGQLMKHFIDFAHEDKKSAVLLTCKDHLIHYYEKFGYVNEGQSASGHGGAIWYDMKLTF